MPISCKLRPCRAFPWRTTSWWQRRRWACKACKRRLPVRVHRGGCWSSSAASCILWRSVQTVLCSRAASPCSRSDPVSNNKIYYLKQKTNRETVLEEQDRLRKMKIMWILQSRHWMTRFNPHCIIQIDFISYSGITYLYWLMTKFCSNDPTYLFLYLKNCSLFK